MIAQPKAPPERDAAASLRRPLLAILCGFFAGVMSSVSLSKGVGLALRQELPSETWGLLVWGNHYLWRCVVALAAAGVAGFIAGSIARRQGAISALIAVLPSSLVWLLLACWRWLAPQTSLDPSSIPIQYQVVAGFCALSVPAIAIVVGKQAGHWIVAVASHFDLRKRTLLGISWYHYLWLWLPIHVVLLDIAWVSVQIVTTLPSAWIHGFESVTPLIFLLSLPVPLRFGLGGLHRAYSLLAGFTTSVTRARDVVKFALGFPLLCVVAQSVLWLVYLWLSKSPF